MREIKNLRKRDGFLLKSIYSVRFCIYFVIITGSDFLFMISSNYDSFIEGIIGIDQKTFIENPLLLPYSWLLLHFGLLIVFNDFLTRDLFEYNQNLLVKIGRRSGLWIGKVCSGIASLASVYSICFLEKMLIWKLWIMKESPDLLKEVNVRTILYSMILSFCGSLFLYLVYNFLILCFKNQMLSFLCCVCIILVGLPTKAWYIPVNSMMLERSQPLAGVSYSIAALILFGGAGVWIIDKIDLLKRENEDGK